MIHPGTDLKFKVTTHIAGFSMRSNDFTIIIRKRWAKIVGVFSKDNMLIDEYGNFYFVLAAVPSGVYYAEFNAYKADSDFNDGVQHIVDEQLLVTVGDDVKRLRCAGETDGAVVIYNRVFTESIGSHIYLADENGEPILDANGERIALTRASGDNGTQIKLSMTGEQVKELLERHNENGVIDTIPEAMDALNDLNPIPFNSINELS
ncbi:MAG: hypothetical protein J1E37_04195 [Prevotella sp.]|nr:hypothetical protein [Prevotella sp.]